MTRDSKQSKEDLRKLRKMLEVVPSKEKVNRIQKTVNDSLQRILDND